MKTGSRVKLIITILLIAFIAYVALNGLSLWKPYKIVPIYEEIEQGLDLQGGLRVVYEAQFEDGETDKDGKISQAISVIRQRLDSEGQTEATISNKTGTSRITVEIPGVSNPRELADILAKPANLEFIDPDGNVILTGKDIESAKPGYQQDGEIVVSLNLNSEGADIFLKETTEHMGEVISINLDGDAISEPTVGAVIADGKAVITGSQDIEQAKTLANLIESGALPVELTQEMTTTLGATLGANALSKAILAGLIGFGVILLFMLLFYRLPGLVADLALVVYILVVLLILVAGNIVLTLPGIAGIILSIGMAVDANVIIFERIKEEMRLGRTPRSAMDAGFQKAWHAILDANVTTIIAAIVLWMFGTGPIQGFAITLMIGIVVSMITAITFTRIILKMIMNSNIKNPWLYGLNKIEKGENA